MEAWNNFIGKKVFVILKNKRSYSGVVEEVNDVGNGLIFLGLRDKFGQFLMFAVSEIEVIEEER